MGSRVADFFWVVMLLLLLGIIGDLDRRDAEAVRRSAGWGTVMAVHGSEAERELYPAGYPRGWIRE